MAKGNGKTRRFVVRPPAPAEPRQAPTADLASLYYEVLEAGIEIAGATMGVMYRFDEEHDCLRIVTSRGLSDHALKNLAVVRRDTGTTSGAAFAQRVAVVVNDMSATPQFGAPSERDVMHGLGVAAAHSTPIIGASGRFWGVLTMYFRVPKIHQSYNPVMLERIVVELAACLDRIARQPGGTEELRASINQSKSFRLAGAIVQCPCHACAFFTSKEEEYRVMLPFMAEGLGAGDKLLHILDHGHRDERLAKLRSAGIDVELAEQSGQLELLPWEQAHMVGGHFDQDRMLADLDGQSIGGNSRYATTRLWSNQEWALGNAPGAEDIVEYEARFNYVWPKTSNVYVCVYDAKKFSAETMTQMLRTHPFAIIDGKMIRNELYVPPDIFLKELRGS